MIKPVLVEPRQDNSLFIKYSDDTEGEFDCRKLLSNEQFTDLSDWKKFQRVYIHPETFDICWSDDLTICKDAVYRILSLRNLAESFRINPDAE